MIERLSAEQREKLRAHAGRAFARAIHYYEHDDLKLYEATELAAHDIVDLVYAIVLRRPGGELEDCRAESLRPDPPTPEWALFDRALEVEMQAKKKRAFLIEAADNLADLLADKVANGG